MSTEEILGYIAIAGVVGFIVWRVFVSKSKEPSSGGGGSWRDDKYPNQDKK